MLMELILDIEVNFNRFYTLLVILGK